MHLIESDPALSKPITDNPSASNPGAGDWFVLIDATDVGAVPPAAARLSDNAAFKPLLITSGVYRLMWDVAKSDLGELVASARQRRPDNERPTVRKPARGSLCGLPQTRTHIVRRSDRASRLFPGRVRRTAKMAQRKQLCGRGCALPVPAGTGIQPGWVHAGDIARQRPARRVSLPGSPSPCRRQSSCSLSRSARGLHGPVRRRHSPRPEAGRGRRGRAGDLGHGEQPDAGPRTGRDRARGRRHRGVRRWIVCTDRRHRTRSCGRTLGRLVETGPRPPAISAFRYRLDTARSRSCFSRPCSRSLRWWRQRPAPRALLCSMPSTVPVRWFSAAAMWCCRCCRRRW